MEILLAVCITLPLVSLDQVPEYSGNARALRREKRQ